MLLPLQVKFEFYDHGLYLDNLIIERGAPQTGDVLIDYANGYSIGDIMGFNQISDSISLISQGLTLEQIYGYNYSENSTLLNFVQNGGHFVPQNNLEPDLILLEDSYEDDNYTNSFPDYIGGNETTLNSGSISRNTSNSGFNSSRSFEFYYQNYNSSVLTDDIELSEGYDHLYIEFDYYVNHASGGNRHQLYISKDGGPFELIDDFGSVAQRKWHNLLFKYSNLENTESIRLKLTSKINSTSSYLDELYGWFDNFVVKQSNQVYINNNFNNTICDYSPNPHASSYYEYMRESS